MAAPKATTTGATAATTSPAPGLMPTGVRYKGLPVPFFFEPESADAFIEMDVAPTDVVLASLPKGGTTWMNKIIFLLLHQLNDEGDDTLSKEEAEARILSTHQVYPEGVPMTPADKPSPLFGPFIFQDFLDQPSPRLFPTHLAGTKFLPKKLVHSEGTGKLIVVLRNMKDTLSSLHFFRGEAKDGWLGNEHGPGSLARFVDEDTPNAYGNSFSWIRNMQECVDNLTPSGRVCVVYFEDLKKDVAKEIDRIAAFLERPLTDAKRRALIEKVGFSSMKSEKSIVGNVLLRKGRIGDWTNHLDDESWGQVDTAMESLRDVAIAQPLFKYHARSTIREFNE